MDPIQAIFDAHTDVGPEGDLDACLQQVTASWVVYLMTDESDRPVQLLCVKNLRASLKRRLGSVEPLGPTRKINYRDLVRRIHWRRVDSAFEADWVYLEAARAIFPETYQGMVGFRPAWFVHADPNAEFPRLTRTTHLHQSTGELIGPVEDKHAAARLVECMEDLFDLCRHHNILVQAPHGNACAYKEMGKCPSPCDGSISLDAYRQSVRQSLETAVNPAGYLLAQEQLMRQAAASLQFEAAARIKSRIDRAAHLGEGAFRHVRRLRDFAFLSLQRGPGRNLVKVFLIAGGHVEQFLSIMREPSHSPDILKRVHERASDFVGQPITSEGAERVGLVAGHLFSARHAQGAFIPLSELDEKTLLRAYRDVGRQKHQPESDGEGIIKELTGI